MLKWKVSLTTYVIREGEINESRDHCSRNRVITGTSSEYQRHLLSEELAALGIDVYYQTVVGDNGGRLETLLTEAEQRSDLIVLCGGLGPTEDDLTKQVVAQHLHKSLVEDQEGLNRLHQFFQQSKRPMTENNLRQVLAIEGGQVLQNPTGLAVGSFVTEGTTSYLLLPGPPNELIPMFQQAARPLLIDAFPQEEQLISRVLRFMALVNPSW